MSPALILGLVGGLLVVAFVANRIFALTRIPDVVLLMALGVLLRPVLGVVHAAELDKATKLLGTLPIILVLFEGGLELNLRDHSPAFSRRPATGVSGLRLQRQSGRVFAG